MKKLLTVLPLCAVWIALPFIMHPLLKSVERMDFIPQAEAMAELQIISMCVILLIGIPVIIVMSIEESCNR